jgi:hypothetical protein
MASESIRWVVFVLSMNDNALKEKKLQRIQDIFDARCSILER